MTFAADEKSIQDSRPVELFTFSGANGVIARYTSYSRDFVYGGNTYSAKQARRGAITVVQSSGDVPPLTVEVAASDPVVQAWAGYGVAPQTFTITVVRLQQTSGAVEQQWTGFVTQCRMQGRTAVFDVNALTDSTVSTQLPKVVVSKLCNHVFMDAYCQYTRLAYSPAVSSIVGRTLVIDDGTRGFASSYNGVDYSKPFRYGEIQHYTTKERRSIVDQSGTGMTTIMLDVPFPTTVHAGDIFLMYRGCDHSIKTCANVFNNSQNFGGMPHIKTADFFFNDLLRIAKGILS